MLEPIPMIVLGLFVLVSLSFYAIVFVFLLRISNRLQEMAESTPTLRPFQRPEIRRDRTEIPPRQDNRPRNTDREPDRSRNPMRGNVMRNKVHPQRTPERTQERTPERTLGGNSGHPGNQGNSARRPFEAQPRPQAVIPKPALREEPAAAPFVRQESTFVRKERESTPVAAPAAVAPVAVAPAPAMAAPAVEAAATEMQNANEVRHGRRIQIKRRNMTLESKSDDQQTASPELQAEPVVEERSTPVETVEAGSSQEETKAVDTSVNTTI